MRRSPPPRAPSGRAEDGPTRAAPAARRAAALALIETWRDVARDLVVVLAGGTGLVRDLALLEDYERVAGGRHHRRGGRLPRPPRRPGRGHRGLRQRRARRRRPAPRLAAGEAGGLIRVDPLPPGAASMRRRSASRPGSAVGSRGSASASSSPGRRGASGSSAGSGTRRTAPSTSSPRALRPTSTRSSKRSARGRSAPTCATSRIARGPATAGLAGFDIRAGGHRGD